jgi:hypothetical protein
MIADYEGEAALKNKIKNMPRMAYILNCCRSLGIEKSMPRLYTG